MKQLLVAIVLLSQPVGAQVAPHRWTGEILGRSVVCHSVSVFSGCAAPNCVDGVGLYCRHSPYPAVSLSIKQVDREFQVEGGICRRGPRRILPLGKFRSPHGPCCVVTGFAMTFFHSDSAAGGFLQNPPVITTYVDGGAQCRHRSGTIRLTLVK